MIGYIIFISGGISKEYFCPDRNRRWGGCIVMANSTLHRPFHAKNRRKVDDGLSLYGADCTRSFSEVKVNPLHYPFSTRKYMTQSLMFRRSAGVCIPQMPLIL